MEAQLRDLRSAGCEKFFHAQVSSVDKARLGERIGSLSDTRVEQILAGLRFQQVSFFGQ